MTPSELLKAKRQLESDLLERLDLFANETGMVPANVYIRIAEIHSVEHRPIIVGVQVTSYV